MSLSLASSKEKGLLTNKRENGWSFFPWNLPTIHLQATLLHEDGRNRNTWEIHWCQGKWVDLAAQGLASTSQRPYPAGFPIQWHIYPGWAALTNAPFALGPSGTQPGKYNTSQLTGNFLKKCLASSPSILFSLSLSLSHTHTHIWWTPLQYLTGGSVIKYLPTNAGDTRDASSIYGSGRSLEVRNDNPRQCSCLENPMDRGAAGVIVHKVAQSQIQLSPHLYHSSTYSVSLYFCTWLLSSHF